MGAQQPLPKSGGNSKVILIVLAVLAFIALGGCCLFGSMFGGMFAAFDAAEKAYYPECENLGGSEQCQACCSQNGHSGYVSGAALNDGGKACGCL